ncbi:MAG: phosphoethanolamine--lipid A transferase [bacterium]|nr:phosphoethanolamine--lipid A transferase [bacterium]
MKIRFKNPPTTTMLCLFVALYLAVFCNIAFAQKALAILHAQKEISPLFVLSVPLVLVAALNLLLLPLSFRPLVKPAMIAIIMMSAVFNYASYSYGVIFDGPMFTNILETNISEAASYVNGGLVAALLLTGLLPCILVAMLELRVNPVKRELKHKAISLALTIAVVGVMGMANYNDYAVIGRTNKAAIKLVVPAYPLKKLALVFYARNLETVPEYKQLAMDAKRAAPVAGQKKKLVVMLLGETQRGMNYSLNGYARKTNEYTEKQGVVSFRNVSSYGTSTAISVPYIFSLMSHDYDGDDEQYRDNALDAIQRAGVKVLWRDNDSGCKKACKNVDYVDLREKYKADKTLCPHGDCYDAVFNVELQKMLPALAKEDTLVVFHLEGAHGPSYWERYPASFRTFTPDCPSNEIQNCSREELLNTYDNTIHYSDHVMAGIINTLKTLDADWDTKLVFLSDHGESLGENGLYLHSFPRGIAPAEQTHVPLIYWSGNKDNTDCIAEHATQKTYDRINMGDTLLGLMGVDTSAYNRANDILDACRQKHSSVTSHTTTVEGG